MIEEDGHGPRCPTCGTLVPIGLALVWAPRSGFACENIACDTWLKMNRWAEVGLAISGLAFMRFVDEKYSGWNLAGVAALVALAIGLISWFTVQPKLAGTRSEQPK